MISRQKNLARRDLLLRLTAMFGPALGPMRAFAGQAAAKYDPVLTPANVFDFRDLAKKKLDPIAWDYLEGGGEDEISLRDNREAFNRIIIRPRALVDVAKIDLSLDLFGQKLDYPILLDPAGGKNSFHMDGELTVARAAAATRALQITNGGAEKIAAGGKEIGRAHG